MNNAALRIATFIVSTVLACGCTSNAGGSGGGGGQAPSSSTGNSSMMITLNPSPPKQGNETITVTLKDATGAAVKGAVVRISTKMPDMAMMGPTLSAQDNGDGSYSAVANLNYQTKWIFDVTASSRNETSTAEFSDVVK
jgi:hypothetical protein